MKKSLLLALLMITTTAHAEDIVLTTQINSFTIPVDHDTAGSARFHVKMYNPTDHDMSMHYRASVCAERKDNQCGHREVNKVIGPRQWLDQTFGINTDTFKYHFEGKYKVTGFIEADGTEHVENAREGQIWAYK